jgi:3-deoxy-manno-octulosonate cytidylyltransferase (CMP-KDO synthetase)
MRIADRVVIATDHDDVADAARAVGAEVAMTRADHPSGTDRVAEVANQPAFAGYDVIVNVQGDEPFVNADAIRGAAACVESGRFPLGTAACSAPVGILADPSIVKVVTDDAGRAMYFSRAAIPFLRDAADANTRAPLVKQHLGVYAYARAALQQWVALPPHPLETAERLEQLRPLAAGLAMGVATVTPVTVGGIDTEEDLRLANARWTVTATSTRSA